jgi:ankyrin repeat protein
MSEALIQAAECGNQKAVFELIASGVPIDSTDSRGRSAVMAAAHANQIDMVRALLESGANVDLQDNMKDNPFLYSGAEGFLEILKLTIAAGANTKLTNRYGGTALIPACHHGHPECVLELLDTTNVDIDHVNNLGWTALIEAVILSDGGPVHQRIVQILVDHGADKSIGDFDGITPLEHAQRKGYVEIVKILSG